MCLPMRAAVGRQARERSIVDNQMDTPPLGHYPVVEPPVLSSSGVRMCGLDSW